MEERLFLKRLNISLKQYCCFNQCDTHITTTDEAIFLYNSSVSELLRISNILDKIFVLLDETEIYLEYFHEKEWKKGYDSDENCYEVQLYTILKNAANKFQDNIDSLTEKVFFLLKFYTKYAPAQIKSRCCLSKAFDEESIDYLSSDINTREISRRINENISLSECIKNDASLFGDYLNDIIK